MIRTFPVYGAAYLNGQPRLGATLTHACEVDADGFPTRVLCKRVKLESICADPTQATDEVPTCKGCAVKARNHGDRWT